MGQIIVPVTVTNTSDATKQITFDALVDTGADFLVLPSSMRKALEPVVVVRQTARLVVFSGVR